MAKIKVGLEVGALESGHKTRGVGFYTKNLLAALKAQDEVEVIELTDPAVVNQVDLIHYPFFDLFYRTLPMVKPKPVVVTVHDVTPLVFPKAYPPGIKGKLKFHLQRQSLQGARAVITDSEASKIDIAKYLNYPSQKIVPIHLAPGQQFNVIKDRQRLEKTRRKYNLANVFALFSGNVNWNKNLVRMTEACRQVGVELVLVGSGFDHPVAENHPELRSYREFLERFGDDPNIRRIGFVEDQELVDLVNLASVSLFPSLYEGFGLPILEAQACETPVITSQISSMPEVAGDGAILIDPTEVDSIAAAIKKVVEDRQFCRQLVVRGLANVKKFSWSKTASQTVEVYRQVLK